MSGIAGVINADHGALIGKMTKALRHRGPDGEGTYLRPNVQLGATWPNGRERDAESRAIFETEQRCAALDGQIQNRAELSENLKRKGHVFATRSDAEILVRLHEEEGEDLFRHLRGVYAFAILDANRVLLARDPLGVKPLHYAFLPESGLFVFASEVKAILQHVAFAPRLDMQAFADSLVLGHPVGNATFFDGIKTVRPGHALIVSFDEQIEVRERPYSAPRPRRDEDLSLGEAQELLGQTLDHVVMEHLGAEEPVGVTLSGGLDSTLLALLAGNKAQHPLHTFTVADDERNPDLGQAAAVAQMIGSRHAPVMMSFDDFMGAIPDCIEAEEVPSSGHAVPFYFLSGKIASRVATCLDGEGADEVFGGYLDYLNWKSRIDFMRRQLPLIEKLGHSPSDDAMAVIERIFSTASPDQRLDVIFDLNLTDRLERFCVNPVDRCAMAAGLDVHLPFLDDRVVGLKHRLPAPFLVRTDIGINKYILRRVLLERFGSAVFDVVLRRKIGAPVAGASSLAKLDELCARTLPENYLATHELGFCFENKRRLVLFELFLEVFMKNRGESRKVGSVSDFLNARADHHVTAGM